MSIKNDKKSTIIFNSSDYDLDDDERKEKYKDYDIILCEKCDQKMRHWLCKKCYDNETEEEEKYRMLYGKCKGCSQVMKIHWCSPCNSKRFQQDFDNWTSGNEDVNKLIKDIQTSAPSKHILEWIPYDKFTDIEFIDKGGFAKIFSAIWEDGRIEKWDQGSNKWKRSGSLKVALKVLDSSENLSKDFFNELRFLKIFPSYYYTRIIQCYGITREPKTLNYALVLELKDCNLRSYLENNTLKLKHKLDIIKSICKGLNCIHRHNIVHRDFHPGNILLSSSKVSDSIVISDFGFCKPAEETSGDNLYGVMPYMAPEILRNKKYGEKSDIYSFGVIINEIISGNMPFLHNPHDEYLAIDICKGSRPSIGPETPESLEKLIQKCWDETPENRPDTDSIHTMLQDFIYAKNEDGSYNFKENTEQYKKFKESSYQTPKITIESPIHSKRLDLPNLHSNSGSGSSLIIVNSDTKNLSIKSSKNSNFSELRIDTDNVKQ